ncbi:hypothetical protein BP1258A_0629 [Burkholderia pseudomallei 1258a]|uniref:Uncharacterized protein n=1 Tax=Burkholderia pseudomallei (strain 1026b) TaxID=884204 RepID=A0A0H3HHM8_BURP2|nr:hypothetical protein BP1026B_I0788 [Burkholderia pseudomallei 1026b]EIF67284.1 hypothetical protein BP1026A_0281 [Burkholderia pseudomallei 1026a]EIF68360.1 hypothetical protein BP1258A_0629 [Burkholderia pseudomallei 1258a]EIF70414.1 hypothetical protein BP1258B_0722 [Burkholderia pseudomallei 1258b]EIF70794.1 hypothetical protein BP354E_5151 [Burkholderia pseudomallei 354e]EIF82097.1 hypothetical protein BP354A_0726 [Burkholderia pseudomallei 354a]
MACVFERGRLACRLRRRIRFRPNDAGHRLPFNSSGTKHANP